MKTTVEVADPLLADARKVAVRKGTTPRALIEPGLRHTLDQEKARKPFRLRLVTFRGRGLHPDAGGGSWERIRSLARSTALCLTHGVRKLWSADRDGSRFPELAVRNPLLA